VNEASSCEPDAEEDGDELAEADAVARAQDVHVLQYVGDGHQAYCTQEPQTCNQRRQGSSDSYIVTFRIHACWFS